MQQHAQRLSPAAVAMPFVALTTAYVYFDTKVRDELVEESEPDELPAEIQLST